MMISSFLVTSNAHAVKPQVEDLARYDEIIQILKENNGPLSGYPDGTLQMRRQQFAETDFSKSERQFTSNILIAVAQALQQGPLQGDDAKFVTAFVTAVKAYDTTRSEVGVKEGRVKERVESRADYPFGSGWSFGWYVFSSPLRMSSLGDSFRVLLFLLPTFAGVFWESVAGLSSSNTDLKVGGAVLFILQAGFWATYSYFNYKKLNPAYRLNARRAQIAFAKAELAKAEQNQLNNDQALTGFTSIEPVTSNATLPLSMITSLQRQTQIPFLYQMLTKIGLFRETDTLTDAGKRPRAESDSGTIGSDPAIGGSLQSGVGTGSDRVTVNVVDTASEGSFEVDRNPLALYPQLPTAPPAATASLAPVSP